MMLIIGLVLFATIVSCVVLSTDRGRYDRYGDDLDATRADDPPMLVADDVPER